MIQKILSAEVRLWGTVVGMVSWKEGDRCASFEYAPRFVSSGIEVSPIRMKLASGVFSFPDLSPKSFFGLPGMLADSLPDGSSGILGALADEIKNYD